MMQFSPNVVEVLKLDITQNDVKVQPSEYFKKEQIIVEFCACENLE